MQLEKTPLQKVMNVLGYGLFLGSIVVAIIYFPSLPDKIATHFNIKGEADGWGSKYTLLVIPIIAVVSVIPIEMLEKRPNLHNYPSYINENNVEMLYKVSIRTLNLSKNGVLIIFGVMLIDSIIAAKNGDSGFNFIWILLLILLVIVPTVWHMVSLSKIKRLHK